MTCRFCQGTGVKTAWCHSVAKPGAEGVSTEEQHPCPVCRATEHVQWQQTIERRFYTFRETGVMPPPKAEP